MGYIEYCDTLCFVYSKNAASATAAATHSCVIGVEAGTLPPHAFMEVTSAGALPHAESNPNRNKIAIRIISRPALPVCRHSTTGSGYRFPARLSGQHPCICSRSAGYSDMPFGRHRPCIQNSNQIGHILVLLWGHIPLAYCGSQYRTVPDAPPLVSILWPSAL